VTSADPSSHLPLQFDPSGLLFAPKPEILQEGQKAWRCAALSARKRASGQRRQRQPTNARLLPFWSSC